jgi:alpha-tubulin suppressor-like RCC1 family protein
MRLAVVRSRLHSSPVTPNGLRTVARIIAILIAFACNDSTDPLRGAKYLVTASDSHPVAGTQLSLKAQLVDANDNPIAFAGRDVAWYDASTGDYPSHFNPDSLETGADGSASTMFSPGARAGVEHLISVLDGNGTRGFAAVITTVAGPPAMYTVRASNDQPEVGSSVLISAQLTDQNGNASKTAGRIVTWSQRPGTGGSFSSLTSTTNSDGVATVTYTLGTLGNWGFWIGATDDQHAAGATDLTSMAGPVETYSLSASVIDPPAGADILVYAQAADAHGNSALVAGRLLTWTKTGSGGSFALPATQTDTRGIATVTFTTSTVAASTYRISATDASGFSGTSPDITTQPQMSLASIAAGMGAFSSCGVASNGNPWCWGANDLGELGIGTTVDRSLPGRVSGNLTMNSLSAGYSHACGVTTSGVVQCWGGNAYGQLGDNTLASRSVPAPIVSSLTLTAVAAGHAHTCALASGGDVYCWGSDGRGQLGDGNQGSNSTAPIKVAGGISFASVSAGGYHTCGITVGGDAYCWGSNANGQLGDSSLTDRSMPSRVAGGLKFTSISAGESHTCGVASGGKAYCWGDDRYGQLGSGPPIAQETTPTAVAGGLSFLALSAGGFHTCGIASDSRAWCWGDNSNSELGTSLPNDNASPSAVAGGLLFNAISAGGGPTGRYYNNPYNPTAYPIIEAHTCGMTTGGVAYCWGSNARGELGYGPTNGAGYTPFKVGGQP